MLIHRSDQRGLTELDWLVSHHTFSFGDYYDPQHMHYHALRVINDDYIAPGGGFGTHGHSDMEIATLVLEGRLEHRDSLGNGGVLEPGDVQYMSAGSGIRHSEFNGSKTEPLHLYQIWIMPERRGTEPLYRTLERVEASPSSSERLLLSKSGRDGSQKILQDVEVSLVTLADGRTWSPQSAPGRHLWIQVVEGKVDVGDSVLDAGDAAKLETAERLTARGAPAAKLMVFDLATFDR